LTIARSDTHIFDEILYYICCFATTGVVWLARVIITKGIKEAIK